MKRLTSLILSTLLLTVSAVATFQSADAQTLNAERCSKKPKPADCR